MLKKTIFSVTVATLLFGATAYAEELETSGTSKVPVSGDISIVKAKAKNEAIKKAVSNALNKAFSYKSYFAKSKSCRGCSFGDKSSWQDRGCSI